MALDIRVVRTEGEMIDAFAVRRNVFIVEQQVPESIERDSYDATADHVVAYLDGIAVGAGRLIVEMRIGRVGRMAVRAPARGRGIGAGVLRALESVAVDRGCSSVELHAQLHAAPFYERLGYRAVGETYLEADIEHVSMRKDLPQS